MVDGAFSSALPAGYMFNRSGLLALSLEKLLLYPPPSIKPLIIQISVMFRSRSLRGVPYFTVMVGPGIFPAAHLSAIGPRRLILARCERPQCLLTPKPTRG